MTGSVPFRHCAPLVRSFTAVRNGYAYATRLEIAIRRILGVCDGKQGGGARGASEFDSAPVRGALGALTVRSDSLVW